jgi:hypothetical protein
MTGAAVAIVVAVFYGLRLRRAQLAAHSARLDLRVD